MSALETKPTENHENRISVKDFIKTSMRKTDTSFGVDGYSFPSFHAHLDKPSKVKMENPKGSTFIDMEVKAKKYIPSPNSYNVRGDLLHGPRFKSNISRSPRTTIIEEVQKQENKKNFPNPFSYTKNFTQQDPNPFLGSSTMKTKAEKGLFISDAIHNGMAVKTSYNPNYSSVEKRTSAKYKMHPTKEKFL
jgi:hypothetical protein